MTFIFEKMHLTLSTYHKASQFIRRQTYSDRIKRIQNDKLHKLIKYCYDNIKYYHELFSEHQIRPVDIKTADDLIHVPLLTKDELRRRFWDFLPRQLPACRVSRTSGSTGIPVCILSDVNSRMNNSAAVIRYRKLLGIHCWRTPILTPQKKQSEARKKPHWTFLQGLHKTFYVNPYSQNSDEIDYSIDIINRLKHPAIIGITPAIRALAWRIRDGVFPPIRPCAVLTTGEYLSEPVRVLLENTFGVNVSDIYACNEAGDIAWQCTKGRHYHINADNCIVEILKDGCPAAVGVAGDVVITNLNRYSMPFIRYKNGDIAIRGSGECPCGITLPVLSQIVGRTGDDIYLPNGRIVSWNHLKGFMNHPAIRQFQIIQNKDGSLVVKFIPEIDANIEHTTTLLMSRFHGLLRDSVSIEFSVVKKIDPAPSGKSKLIIRHYIPPS